jgi:nitrogenase molybdenum-iron protein alpha chain
VKSPPPFGLAWSDRWLREIGRITGKEDAVEALIKEERASIVEELDEVRKKLQGKTVYVFSGDAYAHNMINVARDLGLEVIGVTAYHHDPVFDNPDAELRSLDQVVERGDVPNFSVFTKQPYQAINILRRLKPDIIIFRHPDMAVLGAKLGIPSFYVAGDANTYALYQGVIATGHKLLSALDSKYFLSKVAKRAKFPYTQWWTEQDPFYFVQEDRDASTD